MIEDKVQSAGNGESFSRAATPFLDYPVCSLRATASQLAERTNITLTEYRDRGLLTITVLERPLLCQPTAL